MLFAPAVLAQDQAPWAEALELRGAHQQVFQRVRTEALPNGRAVYRTNEFTSLATGMHAWDGQRWVVADDTIEPWPTGAIARRTAHHIIFAADLASQAAVQITTPDHKVLKLHLLGLAFTDYASGHSQLFASPKSTLGVIQGNEVLWQDAFDGARASVRWRNSRAGCEQDILIENANDLPVPADYGCDAASTRVEVWTELVEWVEPIQSVAILSCQRALKTSQ